MIFHTRNSVYEVDEDKERIRLVESKNAPHHRFEPVGEWKVYQDLHFLQGLGQQSSHMVILWSDGPATVTSPLLPSPIEGNPDGRHQAEDCTSPDAGGC